MLVALWLSKSTLGIFAPITTLIVVQASPWSTLGVSLQRILGTGIGVLVASVWVNLAGLTWWSFLIGVLAALLVARSLPWSVGGQLQIPVAVIFVLALGPGTMQSDLWRVVDVVLGGVIGLLAVFIYPARPRPERFEAALASYRDGIVSTLLSVAADSAVRSAPLADDELHDYVAASRRLRDLADKARTELVQLVEASHWNLRARGVEGDVEDRAARLRRLTGIGVQVRGIVGAANRLYDREGPAPLLDGDSLREIVDLEFALMAVVLGEGDNPVRGTDRLGAERVNAELSKLMMSVADGIDRGPAPHPGLLASVSLIGRLDHVRMQLVDFPAWEE
jgi:uncharacterized membrane protein YccC